MDNINTGSENEAEGDHNRKRVLSSPTPSVEDALLMSDEEDGCHFVEESSDSEPELECDIWDDDCITITCQERQNRVHGYFLIPTCSVEEVSPITKRQKLVEIPNLNDALLKKEFVDTFQHHWAKPADYKSKSVEFITDPFKLCIIDNFIDDDFILNEIRQEMNEIEWNKRHMDLYEFFQSKDLSELESKFINNFYKFLKTDAMTWVQNLTGLTLNKVSATCSFYSDTDYLLVHDDLQEDRSIAFIFYLLDPTVKSDEEPWTTEMGGSLDIFNKTDTGHPNHCVRQIIPRNNRFVFFKVTNDSYHQVSEVLSMNRCRLSINGWFHTPNPDHYKAPHLDTATSGIFNSTGLPPIDSKLSLYSWISTNYLRRRVKLQIQEQMELVSEICLPDFFRAKKIHLLTEALKNNDITWNSVGPPNRIKYEVISNETMPSIVTDFLTLFQSKQMFSLLHEYTDLDLNTNIKNNIKPTVRLELQRWTPGCYSLFLENDWDTEKELDLIMYIGSLDDMQVVGGQTMYVSTEEKTEDALITLGTKANTLNMVFRDTARIIKHVSKRSHSNCFYMFICSYKE